MYFEENQIDVTLPGNWKEMSHRAKLNHLDEILLKDATFPVISKIKQLSIRHQFKKWLWENEMKF
jgi:hypothetical protein